MTMTGQLSRWSDTPWSAKQSVGRGAFCWASLLPPRLYGTAIACEYRVKAIQYDITFFQALASPSLATKKEQAHAIKIHPRIIKKLPQMASRGTLQTPSEPLGDPFGHTPYFKTLLDVIFRHFGSTLASLGAPFWKPFGLLCLSWGLQETKIDEF